MLGDRASGCQWRSGHGPQAHYSAFPGGMREKAGKGEGFVAVRGRVHSLSGQGQSPKDYRWLPPAPLPLVLLADSRRDWYSFHVGEL